MFKYVHHVHYVVQNRDAMVDYLEKTFGLKPHKLEVNRNGIDAEYTVGQTEIHITEPTNATSKPGRYLAQHGPGVFHVAWGVDDIVKAAQELAAKGMKGRPGDKEAPGEAHKSDRGHSSINIDPATSHGIWFQLAGRE